MVHLLAMVIPVCGILRFDPCPVTLPPPYAITGVSVVPMDRERVLEGYTVIVRNGAIEVLGPGDKVTVPGDVVRIDGRGKYLIPGLTEMHTHLGQGEGNPSDALGRQLRLALANGVTTMRGLIAPPGIIPIRDKVNSGAVLGPTLYVAGPSLNGKSVPDPETGRRMVEDAKRQGYDLLKTHGGLTAESYDAIVAASKATGLRLVGHVTQGYGLDRALAAGQQVEHLDGYIAAALPGDGPKPDDQIIEDEIAAKVTPEGIRAVAEMTRQAGVWNGMTLALFQVLAGGASPAELAASPEMKYVPPQAIAAWSDQIRQGPGALPVFLAVRDSIAVALYRCRGTPAGERGRSADFSDNRLRHPPRNAGDGPRRNPGYAVLEAATRNAAEWLGRADAGTIAPGKRADLVLLDANPLADIANAARIRGVMLKGTWYDRAALDQLLREVEVSARGRE